MKLDVAPPIGRLARPSRGMRISVLGGFQLEADGGALLLPEGSQRLLAFLALRGRSSRRQTIAGTLWPFATESQASSNLRSAIARLPGGPMDVQDPHVTLPTKTDCMSDMESMIHHFKLIMEGVKAPPGDCYFPVEGSKGELGMYVVSDGGSKPVRWRIRPPSFVNLSVIAKLAEGHLVSDLIMINASLDIVLGEIDR